MLKNYKKTIIKAPFKKIIVCAPSNYNHAFLDDFEPYRVA
jgi:hypothetical protein